MASAWVSCRELAREAPGFSTVQSSPSGVTVLMFGLLMPAAWQPYRIELMFVAADCGGNHEASLQTGSA